MVRRKQPENWMQAELDRIRKDHPVVATRYYVAEITPGSYERQGDGHGGSEWVSISPKSVMVSPTFYKDRKRAQEWLDQHEPDKGKTLEIRKQTGRQYIHWSG